MALSISRIDVYQTTLPYTHGTYTLSANRTYTSFDATLVRITTTTGLHGWGESTPFGSTYVEAHAAGVRAGIALLAPALLGLDPRRVDRINDVMDNTLNGNESAKAAIDVACWDVFGKSVGLPVCELLGGRTDVKLPLISSVHVDSPERMRDMVEEFRVKGYVGHSVKIAGDSPRLDAERIKACLAGQRAGEFFLVDANCGLSVENALRTLRLLDAKDSTGHHGLDFVLEAPCPTFRECLSLRKRTNIPIYLDELATTDTSLIEMISSDLVEGIGLKISKNGGLTKCRRQRDICLAAGYTVSVQDTVGSDISFAAIVHLAQTVPERSLRCVLDPREMVGVKTADGEFGVAGGRVTAPDEPGLGICVRSDVLGEAIASYF